MYAAGQAVCSDSCGTLSAYKAERALIHPELSVSTILASNVGITILAISVLEACLATRPKLRWNASGCQAIADQIQS